MLARVLCVTRRCAVSGTLMAQTKFSNPHPMQPAHQQQTARYGHSQGHHLLCGQTDRVSYHPHTQQALHLQGDGTCMPCSMWLGSTRLTGRILKPEILVHTMFNTLTTGNLLHSKKYMTARALWLVRAPTG